MNITKLSEQIVAVRRPMGILEIKGGSRLDIIDRMSTNLVRLLGAGEGAATVLTTDIGRIIDRLLVFQGEERCIVMTGEENGDNIARYLLRFVFFNDDFHLKPLHTEMATLFLYGDHLSQLLSTLDISFDLAALPLHHWQEISIVLPDSDQTQLNLSIHKTDPIGQYGLALILPQAQLDQFSSLLADQGVTHLSDAQFESLRIEAALPKLRHELAVEFIPLETGLWDDVSFNKGCYTGQEIIARMDSRGKINRQLVRIEGVDALEVGSDIMLNDKSVGLITSASSKQGLGYVKTSALEKGTQFTAGNSDIFVTPTIEKG